MMNDYLNPYQAPYSPETDPYKDLTDDERLRVALGQCVAYFLMLLVGLALCALLGSCATKKELHQLERRVQTVDQMARQAAQDTHVTEDRSWVDSMVSSRVHSFVAEWQAREQQTETTTETITNSTDSLGRQQRTEQRTTTRTLSREEQQREQQLLQQLDQRWQSRYDHLDSLYHALETNIQTHIADSFYNSKDVVKEPVVNAVPWYLKLWYNFKTCVIILLVFAFFYVTRKIWWPLLKK